MAALGDVSSIIIVSDVYASYQITIPVWPDISMVIPAATGTGPTDGTIPGSVTFS
jgi:hypothetical protein